MCPLVPTQSWFLSYCQRSTIIVMTKQEKIRNCDHYEYQGSSFYRLFSRLKLPRNIESSEIKNIYQQVILSFWKQSARSSEKKNFLFFYSLYLSQVFTHSNFYKEMAEIFKIFLVVVFTNWYDKTFLLLGDGKNGERGY